MAAREAIAVATNITKDQLSPEQRELQAKYKKLVEDIGLRGLTSKEAAQYQALKAKIAAAEEEHWRRQRASTR